MTTVRVDVTPIPAEMLGVGVNVGRRVGVRVMVGEGVGVDVGVSVGVGVGDLASAATMTGCKTMPMTIIEPSMQPSEIPATNATVSSRRARGLSITSANYSTKGIIGNPIAVDLS